MNKNISKREKFRKILKLSFSLILIFTVLILLLKFLPIKNLNSFMNRQNSTRFYDSKGNLIYVLSLEEGLRREYYPIEEIPEQIQKIFIEAEDKDFFRHHGFSVKAFLRAIKQNSSQKKTVSGASTITMQLVRLISPRSKNPTVFTKIAETFIAFRLELKLSKEKILELYLNNLPFGRNRKRRKRNLFKITRGTFNCTNFSAFRNASPTFTLFASCKPGKFLRKRNENRKKP